MEVREELFYLYEKESYVQNKLGIDKKHMQTTVDAIYDACHWLEESCFKNLLKNIRIEISDTPVIDTMALIGIDDNDNDILIFINIAHVVYYFEKEKYDEIFLLHKMTCYEFAVFIFLHEIGHLVHACLQNPNETFIEEKLRIHLNENKKIYNRFKKWVRDSKYNDYEEDNNPKEHNMIHKKYRKLPNEKQADNFAKRYLKNVVQRKKGRK